MKTTDQFKQAIQGYLEQRAKEDRLFAISYAKPAKNIDGCINYILGEVQKSGCNGFADDEIYSMAVHYYDEDSIKASKSTNCKVVINHHVDDQRRQAAPMPKKPTKVKKQENTLQLSIFDV